MRTDRRARSGDRRQRGRVAGGPRADRRVRAGDGGRARRAARGRRAPPVGAAGPPRARPAAARAGVPRARCCPASAVSWSRPGAARVRGPRADALRHRRARARPRRDRRELDLRQPALHRGPRAAARAGPAGGRGHRPLRRPRPDDRGRRRVAGVRILRRADGSAEEALAADLVVAATGRDARVPAWLEALGHPRPHGGAAGRRRRLRQPPAAAPRRRAGRRRHGAHRRRAGPARAACSCSRRSTGAGSCRLGGYGPEHRPPTDPDGHTAFAATVAPPDVAEAIAAAEPLDEPVAHAFPASVRRRYERLRSFPEGLLVVGDAICSFNPTYGQGMTVAAAEAVALHECLEDGPRDLARRFFAAAAAPVDHAWTLSTGADLALPEVAAPPPAQGALLNAYMRRLHATAEGDPLVAGAFIAVVGMREPPPRAAAARGRPPGRCAGRARPRWRERIDGRPAARAARRRRAHPAARGRARRRRRGRRVPARQPGLGRRLGAAARRRRPAPAGGGVGRSRVRPVGGRGLPAVGPRPRGLRRPGARRAGHRARPPGRPRLRRPVGPELGGGRPRPVRERRSDRHRRPARATAGTRSPALWRARGAGEAVHGHDHPPRLPGPAAARQPPRPAAGVRRPHVRRLRPRHAAGGARPLPLRRRRRRPPASASPPRCGRSTGPRWCCGAATTRTCRSPTPSASARPSRGAEVRVLERSGHWPFVDDPAAVAAAVDRFLAGTPSRCPNGERSGWPEGSVRGGSCRYRPRESRSRFPPFVGPAGKGSRPHGCRRALVSGPDPHGRPALHGPARF